MRVGGGSPGSWGEVWSGMAYKQSFAEWSPHLRHVNLAHATLSPGSLLVTNNTRSLLGWGFPF